MTNQPHCKVSPTTTMLYNSVDSYYDIGADGNGGVRMTKHDELSDYSSQSILCAMDRFVKAVNNMNETVMVPCRLLDVDNKTSHQKVPVLMRGEGSPYYFYTALNSVKNDLIWGPTSNDEEEGETPRPCNNTRWSEPAPLNDVKGHARRQSTLSSISISSSSTTSSASDGESEGGCDVSEGGDSGVEDELASTVMENLRGHLSGLSSCLNTLTDTAIYITDRYQEEINE